MNTVKPVGDDECVWSASPDADFVGSGPRGNPSLSLALRLRVAVAE